MREMSTEDRPSSALVFVLEAVLILLSPHESFQKPNLSIGAITWCLVRTLLIQPVEFISKLQAFQYENIPSLNLEALEGYLASELWPSTSTRGASSSVLWKLCTWVEATVKCVVLSLSKGGLAAELSRQNPAGLFSNVITIFDEIKGHQKEPPHITKSNSSESNTPSKYLFETLPGRKSGSKGGWREATCKVLGASLDDVRVHRESAKIDGQNGTSIQIFAACSQLFFSAYNASSSLQSYTVIHTSAVNDLLAPYSIGSSSDISNNPPVTSSRELYSRLVHLCTFTTSNGVHGLRITRKQVQLVRESRKISGHTAIITISEIATGDLIVLAYVASTSQNLELRLNRDKMQEILLDASEKERSILSSEQGSTMVWPLLDRLVLSQPRRQTATSPLVLSIRSKGGAGRCVLQLSLKKSSRVTLSGCMLSVYEVGVAGSLRLVLYHTSSSLTCEMEISTFERMALLGSLKSDPKEWQVTLSHRLSITCENSKISMSLNKTVQKGFILLPYAAEPIQVRIRLMFWNLNFIH